MVGRPGCLFTFDLPQKLGTLRSAIVDEGVDVLLEVVNSFSHLSVESLSLLDSRTKVIEGVVYLLISGHDGVALSGYRLIFGLFSSHSLIL